MSKPAAALTSGVHSLGLSVDDLDEAVQFFTRVLGYVERGRNMEMPVVYLSDGGGLLLSLWRVVDRDWRPPLGKLNIFDHGDRWFGMHHLSLHSTKQNMELIKQRVNGFAPLVEDPMEKVGNVLHSWDKLVKVTAPVERKQDGSVYTMWIEIQKWRLRLEFIAEA